MPKSRIPNDVYPTDPRLGQIVAPYLIEALSWHDQWEFPITIYDPSVGDGNLFRLICKQISDAHIHLHELCYEILTKLEENPPEVITSLSVDINLLEELNTKPEYVDSTLESSWQRSLSVLASNPTNRFNIVVSNPPYKKTILPKFIEYGWKYSDILCYLLPITFLEHCNYRKQFLIDTADHLQFVIPIHPRVNFRNDGKGTAQRTVAWFIWNKYFSYSKLGIDSPFVFTNK